MVSKLGRSHWIQVRKTSKRAEKKLYAALGASEFSAAITESRNYLGKHPKNIHGMTVLASALAMSGQFQLAEYYANLMEKFHGSSPTTKNIKGLAILRRPGLKIEDFRRSIAYFRAAVDMNSKEIAGGLNLGHLYLKMGQASKARAIFKQTSLRCDGCTVAEMGRGTALVRMRKFMSAKRVFDEIISDHPNYLEAHYRLALVEINRKNKDVDSAKAHLSKILDSPKNERLDLKRKANVLLRRIDAKEHGFERETYE